MSLIPKYLSWRINLELWDVGRTRTSGMRKWPPEPQTTASHFPLIQSFDLQNFSVSRAGA